MSSLDGNEVRGINIIWKMENFNYELGDYMSRFDFIWPSNNNRVILAYTGSYSTAKPEIWMQLTKGSEIPFMLSGTISVITAENFTRVLGKFEYNELGTRELKKLKLNDLKSITCTKDILFPDNCLTLLVQLWDFPVMNINTTYYVLSRPILQKSCFKWILDTEFAAAGDSVSKYNKKVPGKFRDMMGQKDINLEMTMFVEKFTKSSISKSNKKNCIVIKASEQAVIKCKVDAINKHGISQTLLETNFFHIVDQISDYLELANIQDIKSKKHLYYPKGCVTLNCYVDLMVFPDAEVKAVDYISDTHNPVEFYKQIDKNYESVHKDTPSYETLNESLYSLYREDQFCDVTFRVEAEVLRCHKTVLCARSSVFRAMFENDMREKEDQTVDIQDVDPDIMRMFLTAIYTDKLENVDWDGALKLYSVADKYDVSVLQKRCSVFLLSCLSVPKFCEVLVLADVHQDENLKHQAQEFFLKHAKKITELPEWNKLMLSNPLLVAQMMQVAFSKLI